MRNTTRLVFMTFAILASALAHANGSIIYDTAEVVASSPNIVRVNQPQQQCYTEQAPVTYSNPASQQRPSVGGAIIGGLVGGAVGSRFGKGDGRLAATGVGAALGAVVGDRYDNNALANQQVQSAPVQRCTTVDSYQTVQKGWFVTYRYNGQTYDTILMNPPGPNIKIRLYLIPVDQ